MGSFLEKPKTEKENMSGNGNGLSYGISSMQGWRMEMEDAHTVKIGLPFNMHEWSFFAIFDGHAGPKVARYSAENLLDEILNNSDFKGTDQQVEKLEPTIDNIVKGIRTGFLNIDAKICNWTETVHGNERSGSTAVGVLISPTHYFFINCGDSRGVLCQNGEPVYSTQDHKPGNPEEMERIVKAGGQVYLQRVNGSLAVSRALGDYDYKLVRDKPAIEQLVSPEPTVTVRERSDQDQFIVLACDGIWDVMKNEDACEFILDRLKISHDLQDICSQVVDTCLFKGSRDNMSITLITLKAIPEVSEEAIQKDKELDEWLEKKIKELFDNAGNKEEVDIPYVLHGIKEEDIGQFPPGGGLQAKRIKIEELMQSIHPTYKKEEVGSI
ncbi:protein phosphatase 1B-like [Antedon mediterranea]|uniref:protein phosphatase 1B-like n=1 Tax=Antedon mediterranea TaxID=105859 RepID=UPI003AF4A48E